MCSTKNVTRQRILTVTDRTCPVMLGVGVGTPKAIDKSISQVALDFCGEL